MTQQLWWMVGIVSVILAGAVGFLLGRRGQGDRLRLTELEEEVERQKAEIAGYKRDVQSHFDQTASLFTSMAGNYRELFEHLSSGYEKLSGGSARDLFRQRVDAVLLEGGASPADVVEEVPPAPEARVPDQEVPASGLAADGSAQDASTDAAAPAVDAPPADGEGAQSNGSAEAPASDRESKVPA
ncbi:MAG: DUF1043 family protein [Rhodocyclaceae bacterium]|nr:DUF1043 family protein [Rhodocyclaceae bacterium]